jgi:TolB-like protein
MRSISTITKVLATILVCLSATAGLAQQQAPALSKVAIFPFTMNTPSDLAYLKDGIRDMLTSRLVWQGKVQIIDRAATDQAVRTRKNALAPEEAVALGKGLKADYVLFGSVTAMGKAVSIDAKMLSTSGGTEPVDLYTQANSLDEVIPKVNQFAEEINRKAFGRTTDSAAKSTEVDLSANMNPELLIPSMMQPGSKVSYLNPNFMEITPEGALRQPGLWRSQTFNAGMLGMDIGDLDGDGKQELVAVTYNTVTVYQRQEGGLRAVAVYTGDKMDRFVWVSVADINRDGRSEIFVTDLRRRNLFGNTVEKVGQGADVDWDPSSLVLSFSAGKLTVLAERAPYMINAVELTKRGKVVIGQQKGKDTTFRPEIHELQLQGRELKPLVTLPLPSRCNVFNFAKADINGDGVDEVVVIDQENRLLVLSGGGDQLWKGSSRFGATTNLIEGKVQDRRYNLVDYICIPSPIIIADLNKDGIPEIIVNDNLGQGRFQPEGFKYYDKGQITSLSWNQMGLVENWKTTEVSGMVTAFRIGDLNQGGVPQLVGSMVMAKDLLKLWESKSTVFSYDLNIAPVKPDKKM